LHEAYVLVHKARLDGTLEDLWQAVTDAQQAEDESDHSDEFEDLWQQFEDFFQAEFSEQSGASRQRTSSSHSENSSSPKATSKQPPDDDYLKGLYHKLVLRLHPDTNPSQTEEDRELFLRVQDAYQWRNVEGLERLYQQLTHSNQGLFHASEAPIGDIMKRRKQVEKRMKVLSQKLKEAKQHPAWGFLNRQQNTRALAQYAREIRFDIQEQVSVLETELQEVAGLISRWEKKAKRAAKAQSPRQKKKSKSPENQANTF
jgi:DnaJ-class molecular chaperone